MKLFISLITIFLNVHYISGVNNRFQERYSWRTLNFQYPDDRSRQDAISSREYIPISNVPVGSEIWRDRFFISVPRWLNGIGSTLNYFRLNDRNTSPVLIPYPNYEMNRIRPNETSYQNKIVSVFRLKVDVCDRLWFVDTGLIDIIGSYRQVIAPRLIIVDLRTDRLIRSYTLGSSDVSQDTLFGGNIVVDVTSDTCDRAFAYIPDFGAYRMVVYSFQENQSWRIKHPYFYFDPFASPFYIDGNLFLWTDGVFGLGLSAVQRDGFRTLYFAPLSSNYQFSVSTRFLRDRSIATNSTTLLEAYRFLGTRGPNMQTTAHMLHEGTGTLFYTLPNRNGIGCWNTVSYADNYTPDTNFILATDDETMIFPNDIILDDNDNIWLLSDRLPVSNNGRITENEVNFRLFVASVRDVVRGTVCDSDRIRNGGTNIGTSNRVSAGSGNSGDSVIFPTSNSNSNLRASLGNIAGTKNSEKLGSKVGSGKRPFS